MYGKIMSLFCASYPPNDGGEVGGSFIIERGKCLVSRRRVGDTADWAGSDGNLGEPDGAPLRS